MEVRWINFAVRRDERGVLIPMESGREVPFAIKRVYSLSKLKSGAVRGGHAHRTLQQVLIALSGKCDVLLDNGFEQVTVDLDKPDRGLWLESMVWHEMRNFSVDCVLLVLAAEHYDEADYIRGREEFLAMTRAKAP